MHELFTAAGSQLCQVYVAAEFHMGHALPTSDHQISSMTTSEQVWQLNLDQPFKR